MTTREPDTDRSRRSPCGLEPQRRLRRILLRTRPFWALVALAVIARSTSILLNEYPRLLELLRRLAPWI